MSKFTLKPGSFEALRSGWAILLGACSGVYIGLLKQEYVEFVAPLGKIYLDILKMCILPIIISAISVSIGRLLSNQGSLKYIKRMVFVFIVSVFFASVLGILAGVIGQPGSDLDEESLSALGSIIQESGSPDLEMFLFTPFVASNEMSLLQGFFFNLVPANIFTALSTGNNLKILFFSILFGLAVASLFGK